MACNKTEKMLENILKCSICQNILQDPKTLSCFHSFCQKCIMQLPKETRENTNGLKCPVCRAFTPDNIVRANFLVNELLEMHNSKQSGIMQSCDQCSKKQPSWKCLDCKIMLCKECKTIHLKIPLLKGHRVVSNDADTDMMCDRLVFCMKHTDQPIIFNCRDCEVPLCIKCKVTQHESHKTETIEDTLERILPEVGTCVDKVKEHIADIGDNDEYLKTKMEDIKTIFDQCRKESKDNMEKVIRNAKEHHKQVVKALDTKEDEELEKLEAWVNRKTEYEQLVEWVSTCNQAAKGVSLMGEIQTGLFGKLKEISTSKKMTEAMVAIDLPILSRNELQDGITDMTGTICYHIAGIFQTYLTGGRTPSLPYKEIFDEPLTKEKTMTLRGSCTRIDFIDGYLWAPIPSANLIQVFDHDGNELPAIKFKAGPRSVKQDSNGEIVLASDSGLFTINSDGTTGPMISGTSGSFSDVSIVGDKMVAINYSKNQAVYFEKSADSWAPKGSMPHHHKVNSSEDTVVLGDNIFLTHRKYGQRIFTKYDNQYQYMSSHNPGQASSNAVQTFRNKIYIIGVDPHNNMLIVTNNRYQLFNSDNDQWKTLNNNMSPHDTEVADFLYCENGSVWILPPSHRENKISKFGAKITRKVKGSQSFGNRGRMLVRN